MSKKLFEVAGLTIWQMDPSDPDYEGDNGVAKPFYFESGDASLTADEAAELSAILATAAFPLQKTSRT
jgi:hypothetical protein